MSIYSSHLFQPTSFSEVGIEGLKHLGQMWWNHHDRRSSDKMLEKRFGHRLDEMRDRRDKIFDFLKARAKKYNQPFNRREVSYKVDMGLGRKYGIMQGIGKPGAVAAGVSNTQAVYDTLHQRAGERGMRAMDRLSNYYDKKGLWQN